MKSLSEIEIRIDKSAYINEDFNDLDGPPRPNQIYFRFRGKDYYHLAGSIGWAPSFEDKQGCVLVIGVTRKETPCFEVLEAVFRSTPRELLQACLTLRERFGFRECSWLFHHWLGDSTRFSAIEDGFNVHEIDPQLHRFGVYTNNPQEFDRPNADELYINQIRSLSANNRLIIPGNFYEVIETLQSMGVQDTSLSDFPAAAALGYAVHDLLVAPSWLTTEKFSILMMAQIVERRVICKNLDPA